MARKLTEWYLIVASIIIFIVSLLFMYWTFIDGILVRKVLNQDFITYQTDKEAYYPGDTVYVSVKGLCKYRDISAQSYLYLTDTISIPYEVKNRSIQKGCIDDDRLIMFTTIPTFLPDGKYHFNGFHQYNVNPVRHGDEGIQVHFITNEFQINSHKIKAID